MKLKSSAFDNNGKIPSKYTCEGENINPELIFENVPKNTVSFVLIMDDPDVPKQVRNDQMWVHWVVFNIPGNSAKIEENSNPGIKGKGNYQHLNYGGPCPPKLYEPSEHRYFFNLYALDVELDLKEGATKEEVLEAMENHVLDKAELVGKYEKTK